MRTTGKAGSACKRIAVIGAGPAGLVALKSLREKGIDAIAYERGNAVGGTWRWGAENGREFLYANLHINTSKRLTAFSGLPFGPDVQPIPDHRDMADYLEAYATHFDLLRHIRLRTSVTRIERAPASGNARWIVETDQGEAGEFDSVVICTGPFSRPNHVPEFAAFAGDYLHSAEYRRPDSQVGKRVCIIGAGNSAVDIASDICSTSEKTVLVARSPVNIIPHTVFGRSLNDISHMLQSRWLPSAIRRRILGILVRAVHGRMTDLGFRPLRKRVHATISSTIVQDILFRRVMVKNGICAIEGRAITFSDGSRDEFDTLIAATGFVTEFPFLPKAIFSVEDNRMDLFNRIVVPGQPGLYFVGMINLDTPINFACERQARWIAEIEASNAVLPDANTMRRKIREKAEWVSRYYGGAARHALQEESTIYYRELDATLREARARRGEAFRQQPATGETQARREPA